MKPLGIVAVILSIGVAVSLAQSAPATGLPPFGSFQSAGFDTVNLQDLNDNFSIPIVSVPGRGTDFNFSIVYDSLLWLKTPTAWVPVVDPSGNPTWGWKKDTYGGVMSHQKITQSTKCFDGNGGSYNGARTTWKGYNYRDPLGTVHNFSIQYVINCTEDTVSGSQYASDNSGYYVDVTSWDNPVAKSPGGLATPTGGSSVDSNGNLISKVTVSSTENDWTDTVGHTVLKVITQPTYIQYKYQDTTGTYQTATLNLTPYTIKTFFQCANTQEYTSSSQVSLPSSLQLPNGRQYIFTYEQTPNSSTGFTTGRVQRVTLPSGGYYEFDYTGSTGNDSVNCADGSTTTITRVVNDGSTSVTWQFSRSSINGLGGTTKIVAPQLPYDSAPNETTVVFNTNGVELTRKVYQGPSTGTPTPAPIRTVTTTWASNGTPATRKTILEDNATQSEIDTTYDSFGNLTLKSEYDWGSNTRGPLVRSTTITYLSTTQYTSRNIRNRLTSMVVKDGAGSPKYRQDTSYDESGYINTICPAGALQHDDAGYGCTFTARGNPTTITTYIDPATPTNGILKHTYYDWFGNVTKADLNCCKSKQWNYSAATHYSFPDSIVTGSGSTTLTTAFTYNQYTGQLISNTDENGQPTTFSYDYLKRPITITRPDGVQELTSYDDVNLTTTTTTPLSNTDALKAIVYSDLLGRTKKTVTSDALGAAYSIVEQQYDPIGRTYKTSNPHNSTAQYWTTTQYDAIGRTRAILLPDGSQSTLLYALNTATSTDAAGKKRKVQVDGLGRQSAVFEPDIANGGSLTVQTIYRYTVQDALASITDGSPSTQTRTYGYDSLGRLTSVATPETNNLSYQYTYDDFDLLRQRTDPRGVITSYTYDTLNRPYQISYNVGSTGVPSTSTTTYAYGSSSAQNNNGRLLSVTDGSGSETYTYDILGRTSQVQKIINGTTYVLGFGYNLASEPTSLTYPSGRVVQAQYDKIGRASRVSSGSATYASTFAYNPAQEITGFTYGNGDTALFTYSSDRLQLQSLIYKQGTSALFGLSYWYKTDATSCPGGSAGNSGQIQCVTDSVASARSVTYTYDALSRLSSATTQGGATYAKWGLSWTYDRYGNRTAQNLTAGSAPAPPTPTDQGTNHISGFSYDANGNVTVEPMTPNSNNYSYDGENQMVQFSSGGSTAGYTYDGNGRRVKKVAASTTTVYIFSGPKVVAEYVNGAAPSAPAKEYVYLGPQLLATISSGVTVTYHHPDHESIRLSTNSAGAKSGEQGHYPFGEAWYLTNSTTKWQFGSYERDSESGNDFALARYSVNRIGRFSSPDLIAGSTSDPQSLNRYAFVRNDPVNNADPSGLLPIPACTFNGSCPGGGGWSNPAEMIWGGFSFWDAWEGLGSDFFDFNSDGGIDFEPGIGELFARLTPGVFDPDEETNSFPGSGGNRLGDPELEKRLQDAIDLALSLLKDPDCASLFGSNVNPSALLHSLATGGPSGSIHLGPLQPGTVAATWPQLSSVPFTNPDGSTIQQSAFLPRANITVNSEPSGAFTAGFNGFMGQNDTMARALTMIHELGHAANFIYGAGSSSIIYDQGTTPLSSAHMSFANSLMVAYRCGHK